MEDLRNEKFKEIVNRERKYWPRVLDHVSKLEKNIRESTPVTGEDVKILKFFLEQLNNTDQYELNHQRSSIGDLEKDQG